MNSNSIFVDQNEKEQYNRSVLFFCVNRRATVFLLTLDKKGGNPIWHIQTKKLWN